MRIPAEYQIWIDARKRHHLSHVHVQMACELGMNPKKLGKLDNHKQELWKLPLPRFIEHLYEKRFGRSRPAIVMPMEQLAQADARKRAARRAAKAQKRAQHHVGIEPSSEQAAGPLPVDAAGG